MELLLTSFLSIDNFCSIKPEADPGFEKGGLFMKTKWYFHMCKKNYTHFYGPQYISLFDA